MGSYNVPIRCSYFTSICSGTFHEVGSGSGLNDAHVGDVGVLSIRERAVSASIEASMHTPKSGDCIGYEADFIVGALL